MSFVRTQYQAFAYAFLALMCVSYQARAERDTNGIPEPVEDLLKSQPHASPNEASKPGRILNPEHTTSTKRSPRLYNPSATNGANDPAVVAVRLSLESVGQSNGKNSKQDILAEQTEAIKLIQRLNPSVEVLGQTQLVLNAIYLRVNDHKTMSEINKISSVQRVTPGGEYNIELKDTVPYVGGKAVRNLFGFDGTGIKVAVLDTGIDYTHANLGGNGTIEAYEEALGTDEYDPRNYNRDGLFPTAKVVEGYDFIGELSSGSTYDDWIMHDDDPIDAGGHGTSVADIIAGENGMAPGAELLAVKVCAGLGGCPGMAIAMGMEYAVEQKADIINLSLGSDYGQPFDDELALAANSASKMGILVVASAANCGDNPYCTGTPAAAKTALSVAQTTVPGRYIPYVSIGATNYKAAWFDWTVPIENMPVSGPLQYADGAFNNVEGCDPFPEGSLDGKVVLVDRGTCYFSTKVQNIEAAGGMIAIVANNVAGNPFQGGFGEGDYPNIPGYMISLQDGDAIKHSLSGPSQQSGEGTITMTIDPATFEDSSGMTAGSTARGPDLSYNSIKPEIGAPGAMMAAVVGTGTGEEPFGGTSGASPVVAGAAALLKQSCKDCSPLALKALLMNNAFRGIKSDTTGELAEITRIGAGEVRVDASLTSTFFAYSPDDDQPSFSLGLLDVTENMAIRRQIKIVNLLQEDQLLEIQPMFRLSEKTDMMSIKVMDGESEVTSMVLLQECGETVLDIVFHINADAIEANHMNSGSESQNPEALDANEIDGYIQIQSIDHNEIALPWHTVARKAAKLIPSSTTLSPGYPNPHIISVVNEGAGIAQVDVFDLMALSDEMHRGAQGAEMPTPDIKAVGFRSLLTSEEECSSGFIFEFAINAWDRLPHLLPVTYYVFLDMNNDGEDDYAIWNWSTESNPSATTVVTELQTQEESYEFYTEHATNSANTILRACGEQLNMTQEGDLLSAPEMEIGVKVEVFDYFYEGPGDELAAFTVIPFSERYSDNPGIGMWTSGGENPGLDIAPGDSGGIGIFDMGSLTHSNPSSLGALVFTNAGRGEGARGAATEDTEAIILLGPGVQGPMALTLNETVSQNDKVVDLGTVCRERVLTASPSKQPSPQPSAAPTISFEPTVSSRPSYGPTPPTPSPTWSPSNEPTPMPTNAPSL